MNLVYNTIPGPGRQRVCICGENRIQEEEPLVPEIFSVDLKAKVDCRGALMARERAGNSRQPVSILLSHL